MKYLALTASVLGLAAFGAACGDDSSPDSAESVVAAIESPTGTVEPETAKLIGQRYQLGLDLEPKSRDKALGHGNASFDLKAECLDGGSASSSGSTTETHGELTIAFDNCCLGPCCKNGTFKAFADRAEGTLFTYSGCVSYDFQASCGESSLRVEGEGCLDPSGAKVRVIAVGDRTFSVAASASFADGKGELMIDGENGSFACTYDGEGGGSCKGDVSFEF